MKTFMSLLTQYYEASGMKLNAIAGAAHISYNYLHYLLTDETRNPSDQVVANLARALRLTGEQTGELLASAGYAPALLYAPLEQVPAVQIPLGEDGPAARLAQRCFRLAQEIPETLQGPFLVELGKLFDYARYKYLFCGGISLADLRFADGTLDGDRQTYYLPADLNMMATVVAELSVKHDDQRAEDPARLEGSPHPPSVADMLASIDQLTGSILAGELSSAVYQPRLGEQMREILHTGVPWEIRRRITEALPGMCTFDAPGACQVLEILRLDRDEKYGVDIRRRVVEALVFLFDAAAPLLPRIVELLRPQEGDDFYVAGATMEACGDLLTRMKQQQRGGAKDTASETSLSIPLPPEQAEILRIQRHLLVMWEGPELECLQYSLALYDLLCAPDAMLLSVREGLRSDEKRMQLVAARYLERVLPLRPMETLQVYKVILREATSRNVRRTVARAMPSLLRCMKESSLPIRTLARTVIVTLAEDSDIHIRRTVADYAMQLFHIDREFLLTILRHLHQDRDQAIRHRLQPVAMRLAEVWFIWYAETAGLVHSTRHKTATPFGE
jgi:Helix-turn-helix domain